MKGGASHPYLALVTSVPAEQPPGNPERGQSINQTTPSGLSSTYNLLFFLSSNSEKGAPPRTPPHFSTEASSSYSLARSRYPSRAHNPSCRAHEKIMSVFFKQMGSCFAGYKTATLTMGGIIAAFIFPVTDTGNLQKRQRNKAGEHRIRS